MGILNVTPDSFSDGGMWTDPETAVRHAVEMVGQGASVIDVGAESTRPGSEPVSAEEELRRLRPVVRRLASELDVPVSVDTMKAEVAEECISLGAEMINDVNGLRGPGMAEVCASSGVYAVIMHMPGEMGSVHAGEMGEGFAEDIRSTLEGLASSAMDAGVGRDRIILDPGMQEGGGVGLPGHGHRRRVGGRRIEGGGVRCGHGPRAQRGGHGRRTGREDQ